MTNNTESPITIDLVALLIERSAGWVVYSRRRGGYAGNLGISELDGARFFKVLRYAEICAFWNQGRPLPAVRLGGRITLAKNS